MKKKLIWLSIFIPGLIYFYHWMFQGTPLENIPGSGTNLTSIIGEYATPALVTIGAFAYGLALINIFRVHLMTVLNRRKGWHMSLVVFISFTIIWSICVWYGWVLPKKTVKFLEIVRTYPEIAVPIKEDMMILPGENNTEIILPLETQFYKYEPNGIVAMLPATNGIVTIPISEEENLTFDSAVLWSFTEKLNNKNYNYNALEFYKDYIFFPLVMTILALLGFYMTYAAYRAFKIRSIEGIILTSVAVIVMIGYDPLGNWLTKWLTKSAVSWMHLPIVAQFLREDINGMVFRSLNVGISIAAIAVSFRIWLGLEKQLTETD